MVKVQIPHVRHVRMSSISLVIRTNASSVIPPPRKPMWLRVDKPLARRNPIERAISLY
jgi:hypothetical protein